MKLKIKKYGNEIKKAKENTWHQSLNIVACLFKF